MPAKCESSIVFPNMTFSLSTSRNRSDMSCDSLLDVDDDYDDCSRELVSFASRSTSPDPNMGNGVIFPISTSHVDTACKMRLSMPIFDDEHIYTLLSEVRKSEYYSVYTAEVRCLASPTDSIDSLRSSVLESLPGMPDHVTIIAYSRSCEAFSQSNVDNEIEALRRIQGHPSSVLLRLLKVFEDKEGDYIYIVTDLYHDTLRDKLDDSTPTLSLDDIRVYAAQILGAIHDMHSLKIIHRGINTKSLFVSCEGHLVLGNFRHAVCQTSEAVEGQSVSRHMGETDLVGFGADVHAYFLVLLELLWSSDLDNDVASEYLRCEVAKNVDANTRGLLEAILRSNDGLRLDRRQATD